MLFSYRGINSEYKYKRGIIEADSQIIAMNKIKEEEDILVIVNLNKVSDMKVLSGLRVNYTKQLEKFENKLNDRARASAEKTKKKSKKKQDSASEDEDTSLANKSPILRGINNLVSRFGNSEPKSPGEKKAKKEKKSKSSGKGSNVIVSEDMYDNLQDMFRERSQSEGSYRDYNQESYQDSMSDKKIEKAEKKPKKDSSKGKKIDWSLIENENNPEFKKNSKIKIKEKEMTMFTRRLHIMLSAGMPLLNSLISLQETSSEKLSGVISDIVEDIQRGSSFSEAISKFPRQFNYTFVSLVSIGETSGNLEKSLKDIIKIKDQERKITGKMKVASMYPIVIGVVLVLLMAGAFLFFIPGFEGLYADQNMELPLFSRIIFAIAGIFPLIIIIGVVLIIAFTILRKKIPEINFMYRTHADNLALKIPVLGKVNNASYMLSFSSTIALMLDNGIRLSDTLSLTGKTINNIYIKNQIEEISSLMIHGLTFSEAISEQENFDEILVNIVLTGEKSGQMVFALKQVSEYYDEELTRQIDSLLELVQPVSIFLIGMALAPIIIAAYLPILELSSGGAGMI